MGMTLKDLQHSEEVRKETIARYYEMLNNLSAEIDALKKAKSDAAQTGKIDDVISTTESITALEKKKVAILEIIDETDKQRFFTDSDCIDAANSITDALIPSIEKQNARIQKLFDEIVSESRKALDLYDQAFDGRRKCMMYHSKYTGSNSDSLGVREMPIAPYFPDIAPLLKKRAQDCAGNIINLSFIRINDI